MVFEQLLVVEEGDGSVLNIPGVLFFRVPSLPKDIKSKFVTLIFSSPIPGDKDDFAGGGGQRDVGCGRGGRSLCQDEASSWGDISSNFSAMDSENIFD